jgi:hypothetical protein
MRSWLAIGALILTLSGCGQDDEDDVVGESKKAIPFEQVPAQVLEAAKKAAPELTFYAAYKDKFNGQDSLELKGRTKSGKIEEIEVSPDGKFLGRE